MIDLENFIISLKCTWIKRVIDGGQSWLDIFNASYGNEIIKKLFEYGDDFITQLIDSSKNKFWIDTFMAWKNVIKIIINDNCYSKGDLMLLPIWYNTHITINKKPIYFQRWHLKGVSIIGDFFRDGTILTKQEFERRFGLQEICFLLFNGIQSAITKFYDN